MNVRLSLFMSAVALCTAGLVSTAHAQQPQNGNHQHGQQGGASSAPQHGGNSAPTTNTPAANNNNMAAHGNTSAPNNAPANNNQPQGNRNEPNRGGGPGGGPGGPGGVDIHGGVNVSFGGRPVVRGAPIVYDDRMRQENDARLAQRDIARRNAAVWESQRYEREAEHRRELETRWGRDFYYRPECRYEINLDANRTARLVRIIDIAEDNHDPALAGRARALLARENARHAREMIGLRIRLGYQ